jgi:hypothetical protein
MALLFAVLLWLGCGVVAAGMVHAKAKGLLSYALRENVLMGPIALFIVIVSQTGSWPPNFRIGPDA